MFNRQSLHVALLVWGGIFSLIAALCMFMSKNFDREKRKWLLCIQLSSAMLLLSDALAWGYRGSAEPIGYYIVRISNFLVFFLSDVILFLFHGYLCCVLSLKKETILPPTFRMKAVYLDAIIGMFFAILSQFTHMYYYIDSNNFYHRNWAHIVSLIIPMIGMLMDLSLLIRYKKKVGKAIFISMVSYIILPFLATIILIFYYGISFINISISISIILMFVTAMVEQNQNLAKKEKEAADMRIAMMMSQIAPHFIYNTLAAIKEMCITDPVLAQETIGEFSDYLRGNLESLSESELIPFELELSHLNSYLAIEKKRFGDKIHIVYDIQVRDFLLPSLTIQPMVENAIKHGIRKKAEGGTIIIRTKEEFQNIYIIIEDDGVGFDTNQKLRDERGHIGLANVKNRLNSVKNATLQIESEVGKGTIVMIVLPQLVNKNGEKKIEYFSSR